jgi:hypothetical protein
LIDIHLVVGQGKRTLAGAEENLDLDVIMEGFLREAMEKCFNVNLMQFRIDPIERSARIETESTDHGDR